MHLLGVWTHNNKNIDVVPLHWNILEKQKAYDQIVSALSIVKIILDYLQDVFP